MTNFETIYKANWQKVFRLCMGYVNDIDVAKDLAQETFIKVWTQLPKFRNESSIGRPYRGRAPEKPTNTKQRDIGKGEEMWSFANNS